MIFSKEEKARWLEDWEQSGLAPEIDFFNHAFDFV